MAEQTPSVGRIVHYVSYGTPNGEYASQCRAAIVAAVPVMDDTDLPDEAGTVNLVVLNPTGLFFNESDYDEGGHGGTWHWPERT